MSFLDLTVGTGAQEYSAYTDPSAIATAKDVNRRVAMVLMQMSDSQSMLLETISSAATELNAEMKETNRVLQLMSDAIKNSASISDNTTRIAALQTTDREDFDKMCAAFEAAGVDLSPSGGTRTDEIAGPPTQYRIFFFKNELANNQEVIRLHVDNLSADSQRVQLSMQKLLSQMTNSREAASNSIKKGGTLADNIIANMRR